MCKTDNQWEPTVRHRELYPVLCGDLNGTDIQKQKERLYVCGQFVLLYSRDWHNTAKQLHSNTN